MNPDLKNLNIKLFADGADLPTMVKMANLDYIKGLTTNPTHMRKAGITDYKEFSRLVLNEIKTKPISFEIFSDDGSIATITKSFSMPKAAIEAAAIAAFDTPEPEPELPTS